MVVPQDQPVFKAKVVLLPHQLLLHHRPIVVILREIRGILGVPVRILWPLVFFERVVIFGMGLLVTLVAKTEDVSNQHQHQRLVPPQRLLPYPVISQPDVLARLEKKVILDVQVRRLWLPVAFEMVIISGMVLLVALVAEMESVSNRLPL